MKDSASYVVLQNRCESGVIVQTFIEGLEFIDECCGVSHASIEFERKRLLLVIVRSGGDDDGHDLPL